MLFCIIDFIDYISFPMPGQMGSMRMNPTGAQSNYSCAPKANPQQSQSVSGGGYQQGLQNQHNDQGSGNIMAQNSYSETKHACIVSLCLKPCTCTHECIP